MDPAICRKSTIGQGDFEDRSFDLGDESELEKLYEIEKQKRIVFDGSTPDMQKARSLRYLGGFAFCRICNLHLLFRKFAFFRIWNLHLKLVVHGPYVYKWKISSRRIGTK